ncbi:hypothetical protein AB3X91_33775 [Paraburkholderia sp. BR14263]|uniref:hypothetical protein n=1 Tax=unclassified Paraburkholderia TaxID=2615204 RepID=UPI0034CF2374
MSTPIEYVSDSRLGVIGSIETTSAGTRVAYNEYRERRRVFDPKSNRTYDVFRRIAGTGDQLVALIAKANRE